MATELQIQANRTNAQLSTGPVTSDGKNAACRNAQRHGILTSKLLLDSEDPAAFDALMDGLHETLEPVGVIEAALVERIAIALWRQRRLVTAETAELQIDRRPTAIAKSVGDLGESGVGLDAKVEILQPFDKQQKTWCCAVIEEYGSLADFTLEQVQANAPHIYGQLQRDADEDHESVEDMIASREGGLVSYLIELIAWCRKQVAAAERRPAILALAKQVRAKRLILPLRQLEVIARYQSTIDGQLYKALRALREAQAWRCSGARTAANDSE